MSEEILKALTQLFAIITKQDGGVTSAERQAVITFFQQELDRASLQEYIDLYDQYSGYHLQTGDGTNEKTSVKDSLKTLAICKKINKTLTQKQKFITLIKLVELVASDKSFTAQRMEIVHTAATVFNISQEEYALIEAFVTQKTFGKLNHPSLLLAAEHPPLDAPASKHLHAHVAGTLVFMHTRSEDIYFVRYAGDEQQMLNGLPMVTNRVYLFAPGTTLKTREGNAVYYSDLVAAFHEEIQHTKLSFEAHIVEHTFAGRVTALHEVSIAEGPGKLIGIMGASGAGKTTLLNVLAGLEKPSRGEIKINGFNIHTQKKEIEGAIGYVSQDDLLIEELTVYQNLYYNTKLCFNNLTESQIQRKVLTMLEDLGLENRKHLKVGSALNKKISGGQRKRLNIALELIREPAILFLDEPTSGLSSRDSENVIDLLKQLSLKGKLIFVVIHQPSSDVFKMFDKMIMMDTGGYPVYYGPPVEAVTYFKKAAHQVDSSRGHCEACGNVNPEQIFNVLEATVVDEYGQPTAKRKTTPAQWNELYRASVVRPRVEKVKEPPIHALHLPGLFKQSVLFAIRDFKAKAANKAYLAINLLEAPLLALVLSFAIRYPSAPEGLAYSFRFNENIPAYLLMAIIVALFMGLTVSAEEIIRDRKILKREAFLNLSWNSYLVSKLGILFLLSAIQTLSFVMVGNAILGIHGMTWAFWLVLWVTSCFANVLGLLISSAFHSAVTVYVLIPLLLIPQMIFSGLLFNFNKLNKLIGHPVHVPLVADVMTSRWAYEAMAVHQFTHNDFEAPFYAYDRAEAQADFKAVYLVDEMKRRLTWVTEHLSAPSDSLQARVAHEVDVLQNTLQTEEYRLGLEPLDARGRWASGLSLKEAAQLAQYFQLYQAHYQKEFNYFGGLAEQKRAFYEREGFDLKAEKDRYYNEKLAELVKNMAVKDRVIEYEGRLVQTIHPIFQSVQPRHALDYRTPFFVPDKKLFGVRLPTYWCNLVVIIGMAGILYGLLYLEVIKYLVGRVESRVNRMLRKDGQ
ncbi:MAG: ATP-binding cassette domain-containing protein [Cyclobacteriaceae bacterium]|jgi:ABC-type multidrug transport system ATPase subunit|nr:ATP-binding cassette domain-containing protein [Cyclobacteriaceae bacterium]